MSAFWHLLRTRRVSPAALVFAALGLAHCSALPPDYAATPEMPPAYGTLISQSLRPYSSFASYTDFEISGPRWVHADSGWNWLVCLRYDDHGRRRYYSFLIANNKVVAARYDILTDRCGAQQYVPFDTTTGAIGTVGVPGQQPTVGAPAQQQPFQLPGQQPIY